jgi:hypothetical protein
MSWKNLQGSGNKAPTPASPRKRGAPPGNKNALKHGKRTREMRALRADIRAHIQRGRALLAAGTEGAKEWE